MDPPHRIVADGALGALQKVAHAAIGKPYAVVGLIFKLRVLAQRRHGGHHLERGARRIEAVARAIQPRVGVGLTLVGPRHGQAHRREQVAGGRVHHHGRAFLHARLFERVAEDGRHLHHCNLRQSTAASRSVGTLRTSG